MLRLVRDGGVVHAEHKPGAALLEILVHACAASAEGVSAAVGAFGELTVQPKLKVALTGKIWCTLLDASAAHAVAPLGLQLYRSLNDKGYSVDVSHIETLLNALDDASHV